MPSDSTKVFVYTYSDPLLESVPDVSNWGEKADQIYQDFGDRQQLQQLLQDLAHNQKTTAVTLRVRQLADLGDSLEAIGELLAQLAALNVLVVADADHADESQPAASPTDLLKLLHTVPEHHRSQQLRRRHARNRLQALPPPGRAPYGYRRGKDRYLIDRSTAPVVKDFFEHFLLYGSLHSSVRYLQKKYSKKISVSTGKRWLTSPVYRGDLEYQTGEVLPDTHLPILSRQEAAQVDRLLRRNRRLPPRTASAPRSLSGLVVCATCQSSLKISRATHKQREYLYLRPIACPRQPRCQALPYQQVLEQTIQQICAELPSAVDAANLPDLDRIKQQIAAQLTAKQGVLAQLPSLVETGVLDSETADLRAYKVRTEMAALQTQLAQLPPVNLKATAQVVSIPQFWFDLSEVERRFYLREFIRQIQIQRSESAWQIQLVFIF